MEKKARPGIEKGHPLFLRSSLRCGLWEKWLQVLFGDDPIPEDPERRTRYIQHSASQAPGGLPPIENGIQLASATTVEAGFKIILGDPHVKAILINIFGGIVRCDRVATGVGEAAKKAHVSVPVVMRLAGTNAELAQTILRDSGLNFLVAGSLKEAAEKVTQAIGA